MRFNRILNGLLRHRLYLILRNVVGVVVIIINHEINHKLNTTVLLEFVIDLQGELHRIQYREKVS